MKSTERSVMRTLRDLLLEVPFLTIRSIEADVRLPGQLSYREVDIIARVQSAGKTFDLICEVKEPGHPQKVKLAIDQLRTLYPNATASTALLVGSSYLSPEARAICRENDIGYVDAIGNCRISFDGVFIERSTETKPKPAVRAFKSIFSPTSSRILRVMMRDPGRSWKVSDLAAAADASIGHVSNVRKALLEREWAETDSEGIRIAAIGELLEAWRDHYEPPRGEERRFYTTLHGKALESALQSVFAAPGKHVRACLASFSAAQWHAPYARVATTYLYADDAAVDALRPALKLEETASGANVEILIPDDRDILTDCTKGLHGLPLTSPLQTYLDLSQAGERGREAADHLREFAWQ